MTTRTENNVDTYRDTFSAIEHFDEMAADAADDLWEWAGTDGERQRTKLIFRGTNAIHSLASALQRVLHGELHVYDDLADSMHDFLDPDFVAELAEELDNWADLAEGWPSPRGKEKRHAKLVRRAAAIARAVAELIRVRGHATDKDIQEAARAGLLFPLSPSVYAILDEVRTEAQTVAHGADGLLDGEQEGTKR